MRALASIALVALVSCDESEAFHTPTPSWSRMLEQPRADPYGRSSVWDDGMAMRSPPPGTIPHDVDRAPPPEETRALLVLGRARFETICAACHGILGDGRSVVAEKMRLRKPPDLGDPDRRTHSREKIARTIEDGFGLMPSYADALPPRERWAVASYVKALQLARSVEARELPPDLSRALDGEREEDR